jgi:hypothetical protein
MRKRRYRRSAWPRAHDKERRGISGEARIAGHGGVREDAVSLSPCKDRLARPKKKGLVKRPKVMKLLILKRN